MSKKAKGKVQSYPNLQSFFEKAEEFLLKKEFQNNLFWEVNRLARKKGMRRWAGNVFMQGRIALSAMITPSSYLLLSTGRQEALLRLLAYGRSKGWKIKGVTGPEESVGLFYENWKGISNSMDRSGKEFTVYSASSRHFSSDPRCPCNRNRSAYELAENSGLGDAIRAGIQSPHPTQCPACSFSGDDAVR